MKVTFQVKHDRGTTLVVVNNYIPGQNRVTMERHLKYVLKSTKIEITNVIREKKPLP